MTSAKRTRGVNCPNFPHVGPCEHCDTPRACIGHGSDLINGACPDCAIELPEFDCDDSDELGLAEFDRVQSS